MDTGLRSLQHTLEAVKQRHLELITPRVGDASVAEAVAAAAYATSEQTSSLLLACTYPIHLFVQAELDPTATGSPRRLIVAMRRPIRRVPAAEVQGLLCPPIERLLVAGLGGAATLIGPMGAHDRKYALVDDLQALLLPTSCRITFKLWQRVGAELIGDLLAGQAEGRQLIDLVGHADVEQFLLAASALGKLGVPRHQRRLRELASDYLLYGYALYMINTNGVRDQLGSDGLAQIMAEAAMEISPADFFLPSSDG